VKDPLSHRTLFQAQFEPHVLADAVAIVDRLGFDPVLCADTFDEGFDFYVPSVNARNRELVPQPT
jgi:hypothetical protein